MTFRLLSAVFVVLLQVTPAAAQGAPEPRVFTEIQVVGNDRFRDKDVLATSGLQPGVLYSEDDLRDAVEALDFTGEFKTVRITSQGDVLTIRVTEAAAYEGALTFGLGYDSDDGVFGAVDARLDDALGFGAQVRGSLTVAESGTRGRLSVFDPDTFSPSFGAGLRLTFDDVAYDAALYAYERTAITPFVVYRAGEQTAFELRLSFSDTEISDVDPSASAILQAEAGGETAQSVGFSVRHGQVDPSTPALTWGTVFDLDVAGFGGDTAFTRARVETSAHLPLPRGFALRSTFELGHITGDDDYTVRAPDRFVLGGASLRGFERGTIGPRDIDGNTVTDLGGNSYAVLRTDILLPVVDPDRGIDVFAFGDIGSAWDLETDAAPSGTLEDAQDWRSSVGLGASVELPFGRLEAYAAFAANGEAEDREQAVGLTLRTGF